MIIEISDVGQIIFLLPLLQNCDGMIRTIIIDDEEHIRKLLFSLLSTECSEIDIIGEADAVKTGIELINSFNPDLVFLDIKLTDGTGFDILTEVENRDFDVSFITAFEEYAIKAFEFSAIDYILKPIDPEALVRAVKRTTHKMKAELSLKMNALLSNIKGDDEKKIVLKTSEHVHLIKVKDIICLESYHNYTTVKVNDGKEILVSRTLKDLSNMLKGYNFLRIHRSYLINPAYIEGYERAEGGSVIMKNGYQIPVSSRKKELLFKYFGEI